MSKLKPWAAGPFELLQHGEDHLKAGSDFDKRMALISYDNAIEVSITTFLQLHPTQRGGQTYERKNKEEWLANYHKKLEFLDLFAKKKGLSLPVSIDEIIYYHNLRNELYHSGNGLVPESKHLDEARAASLSVFSCLFEVDPAPLLRTANVKVVAAATPIISAQSNFLEAFIELERNLKSALQAMGVVERDLQRIPMLQAWRLFVKSIGRVPKGFSGHMERAIAARNAIVHGESTGLSEVELSRCANDLNHIADFIAKYATSIDILPELKKRYPGWIRQDLSAVRLIQKAGRVFLESTISRPAGAVRDEKVERTDLCFIHDGSDDEIGEMFSPDRTAFENAHKFVAEMDPFGMMMCTDLFRPEAEKEISAEFGPTGKRKSEE